MMYCWRARGHHACRSRAEARAAARPRSATASTVELAHAAPVSERTALRTVAIARPARQRRRVPATDGARRQRTEAELRHRRTEDRDRRRAHRRREMQRRRVVRHEHRARPISSADASSDKRAGGIDRARARRRRSPRASVAIGLGRRRSTMRPASASSRASCGIVRPALRRPHAARRERDQRFARPTPCAAAARRPRRAPPSPG